MTLDYLRVGLILGLFQQLTLKQFVLYVYIYFSVYSDRRGRYREASIIYPRVDCCWPSKSTSKLRGVGSEGWPWFHS